MHLAELSRVTDVRWNIFFYSAVIRKCVIAAYKLNEIVLLISSFCTYHTGQLSEGYDWKLTFVLQGRSWGIFQKYAQFFKSTLTHQEYVLYQSTEAKIFPWTEDLQASVTYFVTSRLL